MSDSFKIGSRVEVKSPSTGEWYPGTVRGTLTVPYGVRYDVKRDIDVSPFSGFTYDAADIRAAS